MRMILTAAFTALLAEGAMPPLRVSIVSHNEESTRRTSGYLENQSYYLSNREMVRQLALIIKAKGATWNFQSDWTFLQAVARYDTASVTATTNGKNIVRWLVEDLGFEVDPHAHESRYNYADVAYLHEQLGVTPSRLVGGFLFSPADNPQGWEHHENGIFGRMYPAYFWRADILWGAATALHQGADDETYGIWHPKDKNNFSVNDNARRLVHIGGGCKSSFSTGDLYGIDTYLAALAGGRLSQDGFYTATIMINQGSMTAQTIQTVSRELDRLAPSVAAGAIRYQSLGGVVREWTAAFGARAFQMTCEEMEAAAGR